MDGIRSVDLRCRRPPLCPLRPPSQPLPHTMLMLFDVLVTWQLSMKRECFKMISPPPRSKQQHPVRIWQKNLQLRHFPDFSCQLLVARKIQQQQHQQPQHHQRTLSRFLCKSFFSFSFFPLRSKLSSFASENFAQ